MVHVIHAEGVGAVTTEIKQFFLLKSLCKSWLSVLGDPVRTSVFPKKLILLYLQLFWEERSVKNTVKWNNMLHFLNIWK